MTDKGRVIAEEEREVDEDLEVGNSSEALFDLEEVDLEGEFDDFFLFLDLLWGDVLFGGHLESQDQEEGHLTETWSPGILNEIRGLNYLFRFHELHPLFHAIFPVRREESTQVRDNTRRNQYISCQANVLLAQKF